jgi:hypothetical protein
VFLLPLLLFSGLFANTSSTPAWLRWIKYISPMYYAFLGEMQIEFGVNSPALTFYSLNGQLPPGVNVVLLCAFFLGLLLAAYLVLWLQTWLRFRRNKGKTRKQRRKKKTRPQDNNP